jgi:hypothetical protein
VIITERSQGAPGKQGSRKGEKTAPPAEPRKTSDATAHLGATAQYVVNG